MNADGDDDAGADAAECVVCVVVVVGMVVVEEFVLVKENLSHLHVTFDFLLGVFLITTAARELLIL
jgi:hypothetical protein